MSQYIAAQMVLDSISRSGVRIMTMQLRYPRFVHAEFMTHRVFSRNAMSSRAVPVLKMIEQVRTDPAMPIHWGANQPGMQAAAELQGECRQAVQMFWEEAAAAAADYAEAMNDYGAHKQVVNRILEPFQWMHTIVTSTEWDNFFALRDHDMAEPNIRQLAVQMGRAARMSVPARLEPGQWHLPYVTVPEAQEHGTLKALKASTARCARVSYLNHDGSRPDIDKDIELHDRLVGSVPIHASPAEHQASPDSCGSLEHRYNNPNFHGNFKGWVQYRKFLERGVPVHAHF